jgi:NADH-quinone oxidoreductase subunit E
VIVVKRALTAMALPERLEPEIAAILARVEEPRLALGPMLRAAQRALGWLSDATLAEIAALAGVGADDAANIAGYFDLARSPPEARHVIEVCVNVNCRRRGGDAILARCKERLGLDVGERSADGIFLLEEVVCLKHCESGPAMRVNHEIMDELSVERVDAILSGLPR